MRIWLQLGFRPATLAQLDVRLRDGGGEERQPAPRKFVLHGQVCEGVSRGQPQSSSLSVWRGQEPAQRIGNTILLCAIRDRASKVVLEPRARELRVQYELDRGVREQKLPSFALAPLIHHFHSLAQSGAERGEAFCVELWADEHRYRVQFSGHATGFGQGLTIQFFWDE